MMRSAFSASLIFADKLAGSIAFSSAAVRTLPAAGRRRKEFQNSSQGMLEKGEEFFHVMEDTAELGHLKEKSFG